MEPPYRGGHASESEPDLPDPPIARKPEKTGHHRLCDRRCRPRSHLAEALTRGTPGKVDLDRIDELTLSERGLLHPGEDVEKREGSRLPCRSEPHPRLVDREGRKGVPRGGGIRDVPPEGPSSLD